MKHRERWGNALKLFHKFCPESRSMVTDIEGLNYENILGVVRRIDPTYKRESIVFETSCAFLDEHVPGKLLKGGGRVLAIHDLGVWEYAPLVCFADSLYERVSEGVSMVISGEITNVEFIGGGDTLFVFEADGTILVMDHDDFCIKVTPIQ